jgi:hypothetical protein
VIVVAGHGAFALEDLDANDRLVVGGGREDLRLLRRDDSVARDDLGEDAAGGFDTYEGRNVSENEERRGRKGRTESKRRAIDEDNTFVALLTREDASLYSCSISNSLIRIDALRGLFAVEVLAEELLNLGNSSRAADEAEE